MSMRWLTHARDILARIDGIASCKIGLEANISPSDYPLVRLVPSRLTPGRPYTNRTAEVLVYFGMPTAESEGLEEVYADLFDFEADILEVLRTLGVRYVETITDRDELPTYKMMAIRCEFLDTDRIITQGTGDLAGSYEVEN